MPLKEADVLRLQAKKSSEYPLYVPWDGILVDDSDNEKDLVTGVRHVLAVLFKDQADAIEHEILGYLRVNDLREYLRKPPLFFDNHLRRHSRSHRQAPIYWPLSTSSGSYALWLYYQSLNDDTLYTALNKYVKPKIGVVEKQLLQIDSDLPNSTGRDAIKLRNSLEERRTFLDELCQFRDELARIAGLPYKPNLNDGVLITAAPLWKLFRLPKWRKDLQECWKELGAGEYDWAHLAYSIWPDRVREVCKRDRSIAIAHGLEELCEVAIKPTKRKKPKREELEKAIAGDTE